MNGFEPLRRRIIDYTEAGQWSEVYDGPLEDCESERLKAENAKLREQLEGIVGRSFRTADKMSCLEAENAKLRELGGEVASILFNLDVDRCGLCQRDSINHPCPVYTVKGGECLIKSELRELGIEVDG